VEWQIGKDWDSGRTEMKKIITTHKNTDFDALASLVAGSLIYPDALPVLPRQTNPNVKTFLSIHKDIFEFPRVDQVDLSAVRRLIVVDTNAWRRLDRMDALKKTPDLEIELWDHHPENCDLCPVVSRRETTGANITQMIRVLQERRTLITPIQATLFLAGLYEDTGNLTFPSSCPEDAYAAGYLLDRKADLAMVNRFLSPAYGQKQKEVLFELLRTARRRKINGHRIGIGKMALRGHVEGLAMVIRMYMDIANVDAAFGLFETEGQGKIIVIGRSGVEGLDVGSIMHCLGGGGHPAAGSAVLQEVNLDAIETMITELIQGNQQASVQVGDLMSFPVITADTHTPMSEVAGLLRGNGCTGLPVMENGRLAGIVSRRDFKKLRKQEQFEAPVKAFMSTRVQVIGPGDSPLTAARMMIKHDIGRLPVVQDEQMIGIITRSDCMRYFYDLLPD
jgi:tRNA nucleotidyltransferase (CCA-adding enzyme)